LRTGVRPDGGPAKKLAAAYLFAQVGGAQKAAFQCGSCKKAGLYKERNCSKFFPDLVDEDRRRGWVPRFSGKVGEKEISFPLPQYAIRECPVSYITGESAALVEMLALAEISHERGGVMFGPDSARWPAWWADAQGVVAVIKRAHEKAFEKAAASK
jgi:hypothetical protein